MKEDFKEALILLSSTLIDNGLRVCDIETWLTTEEVSGLVEIYECTKDDYYPKEGEINFWHMANNYIRSIVELYREGFEEVV